MTIDTPWQLLNALTHKRAELVLVLSRINALNLCLCWVMTQSRLLFCLKKSPCTSSSFSYESNWKLPGGVNIPGSLGYTWMPNDKWKCAQKCHKSIRIIFFILFHWEFIWGFSSMWHFQGKLIASCLGAVQVFPVFYLSYSVSKNQEIDCGWS